MKVCKLCGVSKELSEFHPNKQCKDGVVGTCRLCSKLRVKKWYDQTFETRRDRINTRNRSRKLEWIERMGSICFDCKKSFPPCVFDFHHEGDKERNPSAALTMSPEKAEVEMLKCVLLCSNCHRIRHFGKEGVDESSTY